MIIKRNATTDVARGIAVLIMPSVHAVLIYGKPEVQSGMLGSVLGFLAEGIAAPVFMLLMGISITMGKQKSFKRILYRAILLMVLGYLLNFLKFDIPIILGLMPSSFMHENGIPNGVEGLAQLFTMGDILQFASIGYLICSLVFRLPYYVLWAALIASVTVMFSHFLWQSHNPKSLFGILNGLFYGEPPYDFFPIFPWIAYPLTGLTIGYFLLRSIRRNFYPSLFMVGMTFLLTGLLLGRHEPIAWENDFYRLGPGGTLYHLGLVSIWLCFCQVLVFTIRINKAFIFLEWSSKHVTTFYMTQWTVVFWLLPFFGYQHLGLNACLLTMALTTGLSLLITYFISNLNLTQKRFWNVV